MACSITYYGSGVIAAGVDCPSSNAYGCVVSQLGSFLAYAIGAELQTELIILVIFILVLNVRRAILPKRDDMSG